MEIVVMDLGYIFNFSDYNCKLNVVFVVFKFKIFKIV